MKDMLRLWKFLNTVWTCTLSPPFILVPEERLCDGEDVWAQRGWWLYLDEGSHIIIEKKHLSVQATDRVPSWNRTNYFDHINALRFPPWLRHGRAVEHFYGVIAVKEIVVFVVVITVLSLLFLRARQYHHSMLMFPLRRNHGEMRARDIRGSNAAPP